MITILNIGRGPEWIRKLGVAGFLFFLIKGLVWLSIPLALAMKGCF
jgi:hypothetical protein